MLPASKYLSFFFFFNDTATTEIYTLSLHDALPISMEGVRSARGTQPPSNDQAAGFSSLLAAMDGIGGLPALASDALGQALGEGGSAALSALSSLKGAAKDGLKDAADLLAEIGRAHV